MRKPIGLTQTNGDDPFARIASSIWLTQQITGRPATDAAYRTLLGMEGLEQNDENVEKVRALVNR